MALGEVLVILYTIAMLALVLYVTIHDMQKGEYEDSHYKEEEWQ